ncbi:MAG: hypothetical protein FWC26_03240 [Fibromonadales bacterium]|nr:hypothetical protein [Fibromonadales bacterium]
MAKRRCEKRLNQNFQNLQDFQNLQNSSCRIAMQRDASIASLQGNHVNLLIMSLDSHQTIHHSPN